ncbi:MAG TPA: hypothetical protein VGI79_09765 [Caulobacteraceae bacterium]|jgi:hypothetical protein
MTAVAAEQSSRSPVPTKAPFPIRHPWDRNFFLLYIGLIWLGILLGFVPDMIRHVQQHKSPYPLAVHLHAAAMVGWLVLLTTQILLIRADRAAIHRKLGVAGVVLAVAIVALSPIAAVVTDRNRLLGPNPEPGFLSAQLLDIIAFAGAAGAAIALRAHAAAHKRLILLATLCLVDAGFSRVWGRHAVYAALGGGFWAFMTAVYLGNGVLILGIGLYDLITRRRLHPAYVAGSVWVIGLLMLGGLLYISPWWTPVALAIIGR